MNDQNHIPEILLEGLTEEQKQAVSAAPEGHLRIAAGAGSGKTEVLTRRVIAILESDVKPEEMVAITYTQKAAAEMKTRLVEKRKLNPSIMRKMEVSTFHSFLSNFLRKDPFGAGIDRGDAIITESSRQLLVAELKDSFAETYGEEIISGNKALGEKYAKALIEEFGSALSKIRRFLLSPGEFYRLSIQKFADRPDAPEKIEQDCLEWLFKFLNLYLAELRKRNLMDFDEILIKGKSLIEAMRSEEVLPEKRVFLIDEFQDNNPEQFGIVQLFTDNRNGHITVVGDEKQSIYRFQGAEVQTFRGFPADTDVLLGDNFRSYSEILELADSFLKMGSITQQAFYPQNARLGSSPRQNPICCLTWDEDKSDEQICQNLAEMIKQMVDQRLELKKSGKTIKFGDIAIIASSIKALPKELEDALSERKIPYVMSGGLGFYARSEINEVIAFLRILVQPNEDHALIKILTGPIYGLSDSDLASLSLAGRHGDTPLLPHLLALPEDELPINALHFRKLYTHLKSVSHKMSLLELCHKILEQAGFYEYSASQESDLKRMRMENNLNKFLGIVRSFEQNGIFTTIRDFLKYVEKILDSGIEEDEAGLGLEEGDAVKIMTIHKSKGLEFPVVFCPFLKARRYRRSGSLFFTRENGLMVFPEQNSKLPETSSLHKYFEAEKLAEEEEEKRRLYVAFTRAEELLIPCGKLEHSFMEEPDSKKPLQPLALIREILQISPNIGQIRELNEWPEVIAGWLKDGQSPAPQIETVTQDLPAIDTEALTESVKAISEFIHTDFGLAKAGEKLLETYSLQDFNIFKSCPRKYYFTTQHIKSFSENRPSFSSTAGTLVHETIRIFHSNNGHELSPSQKSAKAGEILSQLIPLYGEMGLAARNRANSIAQVYMNSELSSQKPWLFEAEINVRFECDGVPFLMRGFVDRVDRNESGIKIIDFKTREYSAIAHQKYATQMAFYLIASQRGVIGDPGSLNFPSANIAYLNESKLSLIPIEPDISRFEKEVTKAVRAIRNEQSWLPSVNAPCENCGFAVLCHGVFEAKRTE